MKILVTGGSGYKGSVLIPKLLKENYKITNIDTQWFGNHLPKHKNLKNLKKNILDISDNDLKNVHSVIHLASIANDPMSEIDKNLSWETSALGTKILMDKCIKNKVKRFIYASSGSVYGLKRESKVHEKIDLTPISLYNKVKMVTERVVNSYNNQIETFIIRPATVCGLSPRMRLDLTVNILTYKAIKNKNITVYGGSQIRPNIHIDDITNLYIYLLKCKKKFCGTYNAGFENLSVLNIAKLIKNKIPCSIEIIKNTNDPRSYRLNSDKLLKIGFKPKKNILTAIDEMSVFFQSKKNRNKNKQSYFTIKKLKKIFMNKKT
jgi:nucleoside-diphosphate-sugar epimerase